MVPACHTSPATLKPAKLEERKEPTMLEAALLALCIQTADLSSLYLSFDPRASEQEEAMDQMEVRWAERLRGLSADDAAFVVSMHDGFIAAMQMDGQALWAQWENCQTELESPASPSPTSPPCRKG